jgi:uncharacterized protein YkwD
MALATRPKPPAHHKKRAGKHHRTTRHYLKPYLPYLPLLAIMALGFFASTLLAHGSVLGRQTDLTPATLLQDTNAQRAADRESALSLNDQLTNAAQAKADDMVARNYWSHDTPDGRTPWSFITAAGYTYQLAGENLAYGFSSAATVTSGWMNSAEHRANILNAGYSDVGFGIASSTDFNGSGPETVIVALYATPVTTGAVHMSFSVPATAANSGGNVLGAKKASYAQQISVVQLLTKGQAPWSVTLVAVIGAVALTIFAYRHGRAWHRAVRYSEAYVASHPWFDVFIVTIGTLSFILSRSAGFIR